VRVCVKGIDKGINRNTSLRLLLRYKTYWDSGTWPCWHRKAQADNRMPLATLVRLRSGDNGLFRLCNIPEWRETPWRKYRQRLRIRRVHWAERILLPSWTCGPTWCSDGPWTKLDRRWICNDRQLRPRFINSYGHILVDVTDVTDARDPVQWIDQRRYLSSSPGIVDDKGDPLITGWLIAVARGRARHRSSRHRVIPAIVLVLMLILLFCYTNVRANPGEDNERLPFSIEENHVCTMYDRSVSKRIEKSSIHSIDAQMWRANEICYEGPTLQITKWPGDSTSRYRKYVLRTYDNFPR